MQICSSGNPLPGRRGRHRRRPPDSTAPTASRQRREPRAPSTRPAQRSSSGESARGMVVQGNNVRVVGPGNEFGEMLSHREARRVDVGPRRNAQHRAMTRRPRDATIVAGHGATPQGDVGDVLAGATAGPVDYILFGGFGIAADRRSAWTRTTWSVRWLTTPDADQLSVATYNVENLSAATTRSKFDGAGRGRRDNLRRRTSCRWKRSRTTTERPTAATWTPPDAGPSCRGDHGGGRSEPTTGARSTRSTTRTGGTRREHPGGVPVQPGSGDVRRYGPAVTPRPGHRRPGRRGHAATDASPGASTRRTRRGRPAASHWSASSLFTGHEVIVVANHFNSKRGDQNADGRFQPPSAVLGGAATPAGAPSTASSTRSWRWTRWPASWCVGDLNDYQFSPAVSVLTTRRPRRG